MKSQTRQRIESMLEEAQEEILLEELRMQNQALFLANMLLSVNEETRNLAITMMATPSFVN